MKKEGSLGGRKKTHLKKRRRGFYRVDWFTPG
jgi:hypothetical protein